ncbi:hypothetical protein, variant [Aphanomyces invadans]|uniref:Uncharacterized protein n=1 Tax=Aphanomyces invadans TaxID=157072 RepID=A0A024TRH2_9STRA|nr:hypothetical protein, variant [Aphanomyces invadans]ETV96231.1 hypothetical protein, variant [Aphanomyces invadans]|eukprot:XP_008875023.1 hypothetical protein, variant [Aphanomyces invadans]
MLRKLCNLRSTAGFMSTRTQARASACSRFIDMWMLFPTVKDKSSVTRFLRKARILTFVCMYLFENISLFFPSTHVTVDEGQGKRRTVLTVRWSRWCHVCWFASLVLGITLDMRLGRQISTFAKLKNVMDLPIALILALRVRVDDALLCGLSLSSALLGVQLQWTGRPSLITIKSLDSAE